MFYKFIITYPKTGSKRIGYAYANDDTPKETVKNRIMRPLFGDYKLRLYVYGDDFPPINSDYIFDALHQDELVLSVCKLVLRQLLGCNHFDFQLLTGFDPSNAMTLLVELGHIPLARFHSLPCDLRACVASHRTGKDYRKGYGYDY